MGFRCHESAFQDIYVFSVLGTKSSGNDWPFTDPKPFNIGRNYIKLPF
jgi:hypothetical protein